MNEREAYYEKVESRIKVLDHYRKLGERLVPLVDAHEIIPGARESLHTYLDLIKQEIELWRDRIRILKNNPNCPARDPVKSPEAHRLYTQSQIILYEKYKALGASEEDAIKWSLDPKSVMFKKFEDLATIYGLDDKTSATGVNAKFEAYASLLLRIDRFRKYISLSEKLIRIIEKTEATRGVHLLVESHLFFMKEALPELEANASCITQNPTTDIKPISFLLSESETWKEEHLAIFRHYHDLRQKKQPAAEPASPNPRDAIYRLMDDLAVLYDT